MNEFRNYRCWLFKCTDTQFLFHGIVVFLESLQIYSPVLQWDMMVLVWWEVVLLTQKMIFRSHGTHFKDTLWTQLRCMKQLFKCDIYICLISVGTVLCHKQNFNRHTLPTIHHQIFFGGPASFWSRVFVDPFLRVTEAVGMGMMLKTIKLKQIYPKCSMGLEYLPTLGLSW